MAYAQNPSWNVDLKDSEGFSIPANAWTNSLDLKVLVTGTFFPAQTIELSEDEAFDHPASFSFTDSGDPLVREHLLSGLYGGPMDAAFIENGTQYALLWGNLDKSINFYDTVTGALIKNMRPPHTASFTSMSFCRDGAEMLLTTGDYVIELIDVTDGSVIREISKDNYQPAGFERAAISPDGSKIFVYKRHISNGTDVWDVQTGQLVDSLEFTSFSPDGRWLLETNHEDAPLIDTATNQIVQRFHGFRNMLTLVAASGDGRRILTNSPDGVCLWDVQSGRLIHNFRDQIIPYTSVKMNYDGTLVANINSHKATVFDAVTGEPVKTYDNCGASIAFSPDGNTFTESDEVTTLNLWRLPGRYGIGLSDLTEGNHTIYVRLSDGQDHSEVVSHSFNLDLTRPDRPSAPTAEGGQSGDGQITFSWAAASDPQPGSGVAEYEFQVRISPDADPFDVGWINQATSVTVPCLAGEDVYCRVRAIDAARNMGEWSDSSVAYHVNKAPDMPEVSFDPAAPGTLDGVTAVLSGSDPDGDEIVAREIEWLLGATDPEPIATGSRLEPSLTARGQVWTCRARVRDFHGAWSEFSEVSFTIGNTPPSQPIVEIKPDPARADSDLIVDVMQYSIDPDGDEVGYDFTWFKSVDGGGSWIHKVELDGLPQVSNLFINEGELWRVIYTPYEKDSPADLTEAGVKDAADKPVLNRVEGFYAWDQVYVGGNQPPSFAFQSVRTAAESGGIGLDVTWTAGDPDGDAVSVNLYYFDVDYPVWAPVQMFIGEEAGGWQGALPVTGDMTFRLVAVVTDTKGSVTQVVSGEQSVKTAARPNWVIYR